MLHLAYRVFPDSTAAKSGGKPSEPQPTSQQQQILARLTKGVHW